MKSQVNTELKTLQTQGFSVQNRETMEKEEHFILSFDEPKKITNFLGKKGVQVHPQDIETLKGLKLGVDVKYLPDTYAAMAFDIYPVALPTLLTNAALNEEDKKVLAQLNDMIKRKALLVHLAINKLGTGFKGYLKDMDEVIKGNPQAHMKLTGLTFSGDIKENQISSMKQDLKSFAVNVDNALGMELSNLKSQIKMTGTSAYDYESDYTIEKAVINADPQIKIAIDNLDVTSNSSSKDGLVSATLQTKVNKIDIKEMYEHTILENVLFDMKANNFDQEAFERLQQIDVNNDKEMMAVLQQLISKGIELDIPNFSIAKITTQGETIDGFTANTKFKIDKSLDINLLQHNPLLAINAINANLDIALSHGLFGIVAQHPQAVLTMMLFQPKDINNQKVYKIELQNGSLKVNDIPAM